MALAAPPLAILDAFGIAPTTPMRRTTGGLINDTFILGEGDDTGAGSVTNTGTADPAGQRLVVQRISRTYFTDPEAVMENLVRIVGHLEWKSRFENEDQQLPSSRWYPKLHATTAGKPYLFDSDHCIWRALEYIPGHAPTHQFAPNTMRAVATMYGQFLAGVHDLGGPPLRPTVDWYRDLPQITERFFSVFDETAPAKREPVAALVPEIERLSSTVANIEAALGADALRQRAVHNDTKLDNVLLHPNNDRVVAVIDLDVAMEGCAAHDFGDLLRSANQTGSEPDRPFDPDLFRWLAEGFVAGAGESLSDAEITSLPSAGARISLELGLRYLADALSPAPVLQPNPTLALAKGTRNIRLAAGILDAHDALQHTADQLR